MKIIRFLNIFLFAAFILPCANAQPRTVENFNTSWKFFLGDVPDAKNENFVDENWRRLNLPHDWSIEGKFDNDNPAGIGGGALPGGTGWYRKTFAIPNTSKDKNIFVDFDGVYRNSEVWINGHYLGKRPNGYSSFQYDLTPYLKYGNEKNVLRLKLIIRSNPIHAGIPARAFTGMFGSLLRK